MFKKKIYMYEKAQKDISILGARSFHCKTP